MTTLDVTWGNYMVNYMDNYGVSKGDDCEEVSTIGMRTSDSRKRDGVEKYMGSPRYGNNYMINYKGNYVDIRDFSERSNKNSNKGASSAASEFYYSNMQQDSKICSHFQY